MLTRVLHARQTGILWRGQEGLARVWDFCPAPDKNGPLEGREQAVKTLPRQAGEGERAPNKNWEA